MQIRAVPVHGRFHSPSHADAIEKIVGFLEHVEERTKWTFHAPVRDTTAAEVMSEASVRLALDNILVNSADWYTTVQMSMRHLDKADIVACVGGSTCVPASLVRVSAARVLAIGNEGVQATGQDNREESFEDLQDTPMEQRCVDLTQYPPHSIAIVGMAGRFPGADTVDELWKLLQECKSTVERAPVDRFDLPQTGDHAERKWWGNFINDPDAFDHKFFKKSSREALAWDPQQRVLLEVIYQAMESAGYFGAGNPSKTLDYGCYIGAVMNNYYDNLQCHAPTAYATVGTSRCYLSGAMSHYFGWTGPALTIDTACSSSLVAINTACRAIWTGECSRAVAGGTNVISSPFDYENLSAAGFLSPSGQCKPFDAG